MSDTTGWTYIAVSRRRMYKNLPHCRLEVYKQYDGWYVDIQPRNTLRPTKAEAQRLAHALARALEDVNQ